MRNCSSTATSSRCSIPSEFPTHPVRSSTRSRCCSGFIEELREQAEDGQAGEAPILEEGSDGVRLMTVHKAKGLEFPVVILADMTAKIRAAVASRTIDSDRGTCAIRIAGCS